MILRRLYRCHILIMFEDPEARWVPSELKQTVLEEEEEEEEEEEKVEDAS